MFKPYFKTTNEQSKLLNVSTHGMGLMICERITKSLGGSITVDSELNCGSKFSLSFTALNEVVKPFVPKLKSVSPEDRIKMKRLKAAKNQKAVKANNN